ncbi:uncharacterized protein LOC141679365 [Apium graveolens]|uniref:uncharacterized protein LOC141679365 n=1 Tax=Apium graveolens TaxID=4045 RepID=UPI003D796518
MPRYPQANGQAKSSNKIIINNLKRRLTTCKGKWAEELPWVLWSDRTTLKTSTGQTPYSLVYGTEAVLPTEVMILIARYGLLTNDVNNVELSHDKDIVDELTEMAKIRVNTMNMTAGKFADTWEGPYFIDVVMGRGTYRLSSMDGTQIQRAWNASHLKLYHV